MPEQEVMVVEPRLGGDLETLREPAGTLPVDNTANGNPDLGKWILVLISPWLFPFC